MEFKQIKSIKRIQKKTTVYNFHVPQYENYIANGFVTHNCYVARHNTFGNPVTVYSNTNEIIDEIVKHSYTLPAKYQKYSNQQDKWQWCYDVGRLSKNVI